MKFKIYFQQVKHSALTVANEVVTMLSFVGGEQGKKVALLVASEEVTDPSQQLKLSHL